MKSVIILIIVAISSLFIFAYSIHMLIGGMVTLETERWIIVAACSVATVVLALMGFDIYKQRRKMR